MARKKEEEKEKRSFISKLIIFLLIIFLIAIYARYEGTKGIYVKEYNITNQLIPESFNGFKIVQFSDMELGSTFDIDNLHELVEKINHLKPTIVVFTGDMLSKEKNYNKNEREKILKELSRIDALIGKYAVRGDDDTNVTIYENLIQNSDFIDLTNKQEEIYYKGLTPIVLIGLDSLINGNPDIDNLLKNENDELYKILLVHEPDTLNEIKDKNVNLMLAGHSHNSEINIPYLKRLYKIPGATTYYDSEYTINNTKLYISSGLGTSNLKMRLFSKPSISVFKLYHE